MNLNLLSVSLEVSEEEKKLYDEFWALYAPRNANQCFQHCIGSTVHIVDDSMPFGSCDKYIRNIMRVNREKEIRNLNHIKCTGFFKFYGEVSAFSFCGEYSFVRVHCGFRLHHTIVIKLLNLTPSFKNLKVGDHVKFSRVRAEKMPQGDFSFVVDCNCCHVEKLN
ncbi:Protein of unknown function [Gryllus bimaculatus]|nr:Protein of unknown function [Gryllus bimaculatus]